MSEPSNFFPELGRRCRGPISRRSFLEAGALSLLGLGMSDLVRAETIAKAAGRKSQREKSVIFIWLPGGMSHLESYDMKPNAPLEYRGIFSPIKTNVSGIEICEHLPRHAKIADKYTLIRSVCHEFADHGGGQKRFLTGRARASPVGFVNDAPAVTSIINKALTRADEAMPACVAGVDDGRQAIDTFSLGAAYLGPSTTPFMVVGDPSVPDFKVQNIGLTPDPETRLEDRLHLLEGMDKLRRDVDGSGLIGAMDEFSQRAYHMLTSPKVQAAFDLSREPESVRAMRPRWP